MPLELCRKSVDEDVVPSSESVEVWAMPLELCRESVDEDNVPSSE